MILMTSNSEVYILGGTLFYDRDVVETPIYKPPIPSLPDLPPLSGESTVASSSGTSAYPLIPFNEETIDLEEDENENEKDDLESS